VVGSDPETDIAVIEVRAAGLTSIPFANSDRLEVGDFVVAIGNPYRIGQTATMGIVSGLRRTGLGIEDYEEFIQTDASINPGNSGGALIDLQGQLVGMSAALMEGGGGNAGISFAIPANMVQAIADQLVKYGTVRHGQIGIDVDSLSSGKRSKLGLGAGATGVEVKRIEPDSPALRAGLKVGDVLAAINGAPLRDPSDFVNKIGMMRVGDMARLTVLRDRATMILDATLAAPRMKTLKGESLNALIAGAELEIPVGSSARTVHVTAVRKGSNADKAGLRVGDLITMVDDHKLTDADDFAARVSEAKDRLVFTLLRAGRPLRLFVSRTGTLK
jgi:S1-C subfamily serine protease